jgi:hypothetical protein
VINIRDNELKLTDRIMAPFTEDPDIYTGGPDKEKCHI